jgi:Fur family transcriptional regulator, zinc uptake regulator
MSGAKAALSSLGGTSRQTAKGVQVVARARPGRPMRGAGAPPVAQLVSDIIAAAPGPLKAYAVLAELEVRLGRPVSPPTVYRALERLLRVGAIVRVESRAAFLPADPMPAPAVWVLLLCNGCGQARQIADDGLADRIRGLAAAEAFAVARGVIEIDGSCQTCIRKSAAA